jgi:hypothetical protein
LSRVGSLSRASGEAEADIKTPVNLWKSRL